MWLCRTCILRSQARYVPKYQLIKFASARTRATVRFASTSEQLPRVANPSVWHSIVPRFIRERNAPSSAASKKSKSREWNPATFFIVIFLLIGSNAINLIALRNDFTSFIRSTDAKIGLLREVIQRVQKGEDVDVEGLLGTGNAEKEKEWEEVLKEIEEEDVLWRSKKDKERDRRQRRKQEREEQAAKDANASPVAESSFSSPSSDASNTNTTSLKPLTGFY